MACSTYSGSELISAVLRMAPTSNATSIPACKPLPATSPATISKLPSVRMSEDLVEVTPDLERRPVFVFNRQTR